MCELLGMSFNLAVNPSVSFRGFRLRGKENRAGWGLAYYPDNAAQVIKEPVQGDDSGLSAFIRDYPLIKSQVFVSHVRKASAGRVSYSNSHPFARELNGKDYVFAHNGTLQDYQELELQQFKPVGSTDSEYAFCHLLSAIATRDTDVWDPDEMSWLAKKLKSINERGKFNCLLSDGEYLFCYRTIDEKDKGLQFLRRESPYGPIKLKDTDLEVDLRQEKEPNQEGYIVATQALTNERWEDLKTGELLVIRNGTAVFSSKAD